LAAARREVRFIEAFEVQKRVIAAIDRLESAVNADARRKQALGVGGELGIWGH
jgi:hypothetical protein